MDFQVKVDTKAVEKMLGDLSHKANLVMARAANRAGTRAKTIIKREVYARYLIGKDDVEKTMRVYRANKNKPFVVLKSTGYHSGLAKFEVSPFHVVNYSGEKGNKKRDPDMYEAAVKKGQGLKGLGKKAFVAKMKNGHRGVFRRKRGILGRIGEIEEIYGPAIPQVIKNEEILRKAEEEAGKTMQKRLAHEVDAVLKKYVD